ncbi:MAG: hypothetical protein IKB72_06100 [Ruminococcus sp.]|nr:hypothetical protein [Ruminococcus sp.]
MKKLSILMAVIMFFCVYLAGCGEEGKKTSSNGSEYMDNDEVTRSFDANEVLSQLNVKTYEYDAGEDISPNRQIYIVVENTSEFNIKLSSKLTTYNDNNAIVEVETRQIGYLEAGQKAVVYYDYLDKYSSFDYTITPEQHSANYLATSNISYDIVETENSRFFVTATNNNDFVADVWGTMFFYRNGVLTKVQRLKFGDGGIGKGVSSTNEFYVTLGSTDVNYTYEFVLEADRWY